MNEFYLYVSSASTTNHKNNCFNDFNITLPHQIHLKGYQWKVGVCDVTFKKGTVIPYFHLCSDLIESNFDSTSSVPIMRFVHRQETEVITSFANIYYSKVKNEFLDTIHFYLKSVGEVFPSLAETVFYCTLHFKRDG